MKFQAHLLNWKGRLGWRWQCQQALLFYSAARQFGREYHVSVHSRF